MKAISKLVAVPLVILIMIILVSLTYNFAINSSPQKQVLFLSASCSELGDGERVFTFDIRNPGPNIIKSSEISVFIDGFEASLEVSFNDIQPNSNEERFAKSKTEIQRISGEHNIRIKTSGFEAQKTVICP